MMWTAQANPDVLVKASSATVVMICRLVLPAPSGYVETDSGAIVRAMKSTYKRNAILNLSAALAIASGRVFAQTTEQKKRRDFRRFLDAVLAELPADKEIHVILDHYTTHKRNADWLDKYQGRVQFHFTPTSARWLNQVEIWFGLLTRKALRGASFANKDQLRSAIESFVTNTIQHPSHSTGASEKSREVNYAIRLSIYATKH
jgi:transposase